MSTATEDITVTAAEIVGTPAPTTSPVVDLSKLTERELAAELQRRTALKEGNKVAYKSLSNEVVPTLFQKLLIYSQIGAEIKADIYSSLKTLIKLKFEAYGIKSDQMSHTFTADNGDSITIGYNVNRGYDDTAFLGVAKVKEFINSLATDAQTAKLINQITRLLRPTKTGDLDPKRILELRQMTNDYSDPNLLEGVKIIEDAYNPTRSTWFIQAKYKNGVGIEVNLPLSLSAAPFPTDFDLSFLLDEEK